VSGDASLDQLCVFGQAGQPGGVGAALGLGGGLGGCGGPVLISCCQQQDGLEQGHVPE